MVDPIHEYYNHGLLFETITNRQSKTSREDLHPRDLLTHFCIFFASFTFAASSSLNLNPNKTNRAHKQAIAFFTE